MEMSEEKKIEVLLMQLQERYDALHKMRDRSMQFVLWILGFGLGMAWLLINEASFTLAQKILISILLVILGATTFYFVYSIGRGFNVTRQIIIKLETSLKLYDKNYYNISDSILPPKYSSQKTGVTGHFKTLNALIIVVLLSLIILTLANPCKPKSINDSETPDPNQIQVKTFNK
ncbi:MAG: hypothetical protein ACYSSI_03680 [Planctomycetota bacterium]|jgi:hypothetical protein